MVEAQSVSAASTTRASARTWPSSAGPGTCRPPTPRCWPRLLLARTEGIILALESAHALAWVSRERASLAGKVVLVNLSGRGDKDVAQVAEILDAGPA